MKELLIGMFLSLLSLLFVFASGEIIIRTVLFSDWMPDNALRVPWRYADPDCDDDAWKLAYLLRADTDSHGGGTFDARLGWIPQTDGDNPYGVITETALTSASWTNPVLFFGDSFVEGVTENIVDRVPQQLDLLIKDRPVLNLGVSGYGVDQIYLRFADITGHASNPVVVIGLLTDDINRTVLSFRGAPKPFFDVEDGELVQKNMPLTADIDDYIAKHPVSIRSYFLRLVLIKARAVSGASFFDDVLGYSAQETKKRILNRRLLQAIREKSQEMKVPVYFVLFYGGKEFTAPLWQETYLKDTLDSLGMKYLDTKSVLQGHMAKTGLTQSDYYYANDGHTNELGNRVIAEALYGLLKSSEPSIN